MTETTIWTPPPEEWGHDDARAVLAVRTGGEDTDPKYGWGVNLAGPVRVTPGTASLIDEWAARTLNLYGGYVHLIFVDADEDAANVDELRGRVADLREYDDGDESYLVRKVLQ